MRCAFIFLVAMLISGCASKIVTPAIYQAAEKLCAKNGGLRYVEATGDYFRTSCNNDAFFDWRTLRERTLL